jgi:hypothetical protein
VELNLKVPVRDERKKKQDCLEVKVRPLISSMQQRPSVKKLLAYEKEVNEELPRLAPGPGAMSKVKI